MHLAKNESTNPFGEHRGTHNMAQDNQSDVLIQVERLSKAYENASKVWALNEISFEVHQGEFLSIMGPSGSGKTTLLNLVGTLDKPTLGKVLFSGQDTAELRGDQLADFRREHIGFIFQLFHLLPELTALENVMLPLMPLRRRLPFSLEAHAMDLLKMVGLAERAGHLPGQLSGGEQQRVAIARALINHPKVLLADEPTGNLDTNSGQRIIDLLLQLNQTIGLTVLMATHNPELAKQTHRILELRDGHLVNVRKPN